MQKRISHFRIYTISFIVWFILVVIIGVLLSNDFFKTSKEDILRLVNEEIPVELNVADIKLVFPFNLDLYNITVCTKDSKDEFLYLEHLQLIINPLRYFIRDNVYDILYYISSKNGTFYTKHFDIDNINKYNVATKPTSSKETLVTANEILYILENKSIIIDNFAVKYDKGAADDFDLSLDRLSAYFTETKYILDSTFNLPDNTKLTVNLDSSKNIYISTNVDKYLNIEKAALKLRATDRSGILFDYGLDLSLTNDYLKALLHTKKDSRITATSLVDNKDKDVISVEYNLKNKQADFELYDLTITQKMIYKSIDMLKDVKNTGMKNIVPVEFIETDGEKFAEALGYINGFVSSHINLKGHYDPEKPIYIDMNSKTKLRALSLDFALELTNNILISDRFNLDIEDTANVSATLYAPLEDIYATKFSANVRELKLGEHEASFDIKLSTVFNKVNTSFSQLQIENVRFNQFYIQNETFDILVNKVAKRARIKNTNADDDIFAFDVFFKDTEDMSLSGRGVLPTAFINNLAGKNVIDPLVLVHAEYTVTNVNNKNKNIKHDLSVYSENIIGFEKIFEVDTTFINNQLLLNSFVLKPDGSAPIKAHGKAFQSSTDKWVVSMDVATPVGEYNPTAVISKYNDRVVVDLKTADAVIEGSGVVGFDGAINFDLETKERLSFDGVDVLANVHLAKKAQQDDIDLNGNLDINFSKNNVHFNATSDFMLAKDNTIMMTNIVYQQLGYRLNGTGSFKMENNIAANVKLALREDRGGEGSIYANVIVNADHINADIDTRKIPISAVYTTSKFDGYFSGGAIIVGSTKSPSVVLRDVELTEFDFAGERFHITAKGEYRDKKAIIDEVLIVKHGRMNVYLDNRETIRIYDSIISEDRQWVNVDVKNYVLLSTFNAKLKYNMVKDNYGKSVYNVTGTGLRINNRKLPNLNTTAIYDGTRIAFSHRGGHGLRGNMLLLDGTAIFNTWYIYDNVELLNGYGEVRGGRANMYLVSEKLGLEIFEIFNVIFKRIDTYEGDFTFRQGDKDYTLYSHITGELSNLSIDGRFVGRGKVVSQYFKDTFDDSTVDFDFNGKVFNINQLTLLTKKNSRGVVMVGAADFLNNSFDNMNFHMTTEGEAKGTFWSAGIDEGFLDANADFGIFKTIGLVKLELDFLDSMTEPTIAGDVYIERNELQFTVSPTTRRYTSSIYRTAHKVNYDLTVHAIARTQVSYNLLGNMTLQEDSTLTVKNNLINGVELDGNLEIERGTIYYLQNVYDVESGSVEFLGTSDIDPIINLTSSTKKRYINSGSSYDVTLYMDIANTKLSSLLGTGGEVMASAPILFYTQPPLSTYETSLLAGVNPSETRSIEAVATASGSLEDNISNTSDQLSGIVSSYSGLLLRNYAFRPLERWLRQYLSIDYFGVNTEVVDRLLFENDQNYDIDEYLAGTGVELGAYVSRDLFLKVGFTYDATDSVSTLSGIEEQTYGIVPNVGFEISLPYFKLANLVFEYNIVPIGIEKGQDFGLKGRYRF